MRKTLISLFSLSMVCLLTLVGCKPASQSAPASGASSAAPASQTATALQGATTTQSFASPMSPGLWEISLKSDQMREMPKMSPQQAEQMRKMGMNVPEVRDGAMIMKVCYTKEMLAQRQVPATQNDRECKPQNMRHGSGSFSGEIVCNGPNMKGTGTMQGTMSSTSFQTNTSFNGTMGGQPMKTSSATSGKYLGPDCGNVKPMGMR